MTKMIANLFTLVFCLAAGSVAAQDQESIMMEQQQRADCVAKYIRYQRCIDGHQECCSDISSEVDLPEECYDCFDDAQDFYSAVKLQAIVQKDAAVAAKAAKLEEQGIAAKQPNVLAWSLFVVGVTTGVLCGYMLGSQGSAK